MKTVQNFSKHILEVVKSTLKYFKNRHMLKTLIHFCNILC